MGCRLITGLQAVALCGCAMLLTGSFALADSGEASLTTQPQEELTAQPQEVLGALPAPRVLPEENVVFFATSDRRVHLQLLKLGQSASQALAGTPVAVIGPDATATPFVADASGMVTITDARAGLHSVVSASPNGHLAVPLVFRELADEQFAAMAGGNSARSLSTAMLPLADVGPGEVMRAVTSYLPPPHAAGTLADIDTELVFESEVAGAHRYQVAVQEDGRLVGQVYSLLRPESVNGSLGGANVMVFRGSELIARGISDEQGTFAFENVMPGIYSFVAAGPCGYAAFAFEVVQGGGFADNASDESMVSTAGNGVRLVSMNQPPAAGRSLSVMLVPAPVVPAVVNVMRTAFPVGPGPGVAPGLAGPPGFAPVAGGFGGGFGGGPGGGFGGGGGGLGGGGIGGVGGLLGLAGVGAAAAAAGRGRGNGPPFPTPPVATPAQPGQQGPPAGVPPSSTGGPQ